MTLKLKRRQAGAPEPHKFLGHGHCDNLSRSATLGRATASAADLVAVAGELLTAIGVPAVEIRGIGVTVRAVCVGSGILYFINILLLFHYFLS